MKRIALLLALATAAVYANRSLGAEGDWPQFRGPGGQGNARDAALPLRWSETEGVRWKTPLPGRGWSSPVVAGSSVWLTAAIESAASEERRAALLKEVEKYPVGDQMIALASIDLVALEVDLSTGELLRRVDLFTVAEPPPIHGLNSYASPTPIVAGGRCYCHFGTFGTACVDAASGEIIWRRQLKIDHIVGPGSSPALDGDALIVPCDGGDLQFVIALDAASGETRWKRDRPPLREENPDQRKAYSTPLVIEVDGRRQAVIPGSQWFVAYDVVDGEEVWRVDHGPGFSNVPRPVYDGKLLYLCTGFGKPQIWGVRADGSGDVSDTHVVWRQRQQAPSMASPSLSGGRLYMVSEGGVVTCLEAATGEPLWRERVPGKYSASPLLGAGRVYLCSQEGVTSVLADGPQFELLARNEVDGMLMASPAATGGDLLLRSDTTLYRIGGE